MVDEITAKPEPIPEEEEKKEDIIDEYDPETGPDIDDEDDLVSKCCKTS